MASEQQSTEQLIERIVEKLFINGMGQKATRLVLMDESQPYVKRDLGGWCKDAVRRAIREELAAQQQGEGKRDV